MEQGSVTVGANYHFYSRQLAHLMARFRQRHPGIAFQTIEGTSTTLAGALREHRADLCIISRRPGSHQWFPLRRDQLVVMLSPEHPLAREKSVPIRRLETESYIGSSPAGRRTTPAFWRKTACSRATALPGWRTIFPPWLWWRLALAWHWSTT